MFEHSVVFLLLLFCSACEVVMANLKEQRVCLKFCFLLEKSATKAYQMLQQAFKEDAMSRTQVFEWFGHFKRGEMSVEDHARSGRPSTSRNDEN